MNHSKQWREQLDEFKKRFRYGVEGGAYDPSAVFERVKIADSNATKYAHELYRRIA